MRRQGNTDSSNGYGGPSSAVLLPLPRSPRRKRNYLLDIVSIAAVSVSNNGDRPRVAINCAPAIIPRRVPLLSVTFANPLSFILSASVLIWHPASLPLRHAIASEALSRLFAYPLAYQGEKQIKHMTHSNAQRTDKACD